MPREIGIVQVNPEDIVLEDVWMIIGQNLEVVWRANLVYEGIYVVHDNKREWRRKQLVCSNNVPANVVMTTS